MSRHPVVLATLLGAALCATPLAAQTDTTTQATAPITAEAPPQQLVHPRRSLNTINYEEFRTGQYADAYELIHHLRPTWLRTPRGATSWMAQGDLAVFMDGVRVGVSREALHGVSINTVRSLKFYTAVDARQRFGGDTSAGAIELYTHE